MTGLIERLEAAEVGSRELDIALGQSLGLIDGDLIYTAPDGSRMGFGNADPWPKWTDSLDRALALAERVLPGCEPGVMFEQRLSDRVIWGAYTSLGQQSVFAATPALALCAAILRAKEQAS